MIGIGGFRVGLRFGGGGWLGDGGGWCGDDSDSILRRGHSGLSRSVAVSAPACASDHWSVADG